MSSGWIGFRGSGLDFAQCGEYPDGFDITPLSITASGLTVNCIGAPSSVNLTAVGGVPPFRWSVAAVTWAIVQPSGSPAFRTGVLTAAFPCPGTHIAVVTCTDERGVEATKEIQVSGVEVIIPKIALTISVNTFDYNIFFAARAAGWDGVSEVDVTVTINAGVFVRASHTGTYAMDTGAPWPSGTAVKLINNGYIFAKGGNGGIGGIEGVNATNGTRGGDAMNIQRTILIDNTNGQIFGGGGGGGGGGGAYAECNCGKNGCSEGRPQGGGGGGGAGGGLAGNSGTNGNDTILNNAFGSGGSSILSSCNAVSGAGGRGGDWAHPGENGRPGNVGDGSFTTAGIGGHPGGKAINTNGNVIIWLGGNDTIKVRGRVE